MTLNLPLIGGAHDSAITRTSASVQSGRAETMFAVIFDTSGKYTDEEKIDAMKKEADYTDNFYKKSHREGEPLWQACSYVVEWFDSLSTEDQAFLRQRGWNRDAYVARVDYWRSSWPEATTESLGRPGGGGGAGPAGPDAHLKDPKWQSVMKMFREMEANFSAWMKDQSRRWGILQTSGLERQDVVDLSPEAMQHLQETAAEAEAVNA